MSERAASRWGWHRDWAGFSGGLWPREGRPSQTTVLAIYGCGYFLDVCLPMLGDVRIGWHTRDWLRGHYGRDDSRFVLDRDPWPSSRKPRRRGKRAATGLADPRPGSRE